MIWRGKGRWTLVVLYACLYLLPGFWHVHEGQTWAQAVRPNQYGVPFIAGLSLAGVILIAWGGYLNWRPARKVIQPETGRTYMARPSHSMYYIKMEYWGAAALIGAIVMWVKLR